MMLDRDRRRHLANAHAYVERLQDALPLRALRDHVVRAEIRELPG